MPSGGICPDSGEELDPRPGRGDPDGEEGVQGSERQVVQVWRPRPSGLRRSYQYDPGSVSPYLVYHSGY